MTNSLREISGDRYSDLTGLSYAYSRELSRNRDADIPKINKKELVDYQRFLKEKAILSRITSTS